MVAELADHGWLRALAALGAKYAEGKEGESRVCRLTCAAAFSRWARVTKHSERKLSPMSAPHLTHLSAPGQQFSAPERSLAGDWKYAKVIGDEASITLEHEQMEGVNQEQQEHVEVRSPGMPRKPRVCQVCMETEYRPLVVCERPRGCGRRAHAFRCAIIINEEGVHRWRCRICRPRPYADVPLVPRDAAAEQSAADIEDAAIKQLDDLEHWDRVEAARLLSRQAADSGMQGVASRSSEGSEEEDEGPSLGTSEPAADTDGAGDEEPEGIREHAQQWMDLQEHELAQVASHRNDQSESTLHEGHLGSECRNAKRQAAREEGDPLDPGNLDRKRYCTEFHTVNERLKVTTTVTTRNVTTRVTTIAKPGTSDKQCRSTQGKRCNTGWLQAMQEHARVVEDHVASHHDDQDESTFHGSHPGSECRNTGRHAALEEGDPREKPARKKVKAEATAEQQAEKPGKVERCQCSSMPLLCRCSLSCQCSQTIRLIVLQEREDFPGRWKQGWCHRCIKPALWMCMQPKS